MCVWKACQWCQGWEMLQCGFLHTLLALAFPATFLTLPPSHHPLCCNIPTFFHPFTSSSPLPPFPPSLFACSPLSDHSYPSSLLHHPVQSQPLPPSLCPPSTFSPPHHPPLFSSTHYFLRFSNMPFHRMLPPVSLGRKKKGGGGYWYSSSGSWLR